MSSTNFAAAQERVLERRRLREAEARNRLAEQQRASPLNHPALSRLPYPLNRIPQSSVTLWDSIKGREGSRPAFRVGQVDAELLDEELLGLLKGQVGNALKYFGVWPRISAILIVYFSITNYLDVMLAPITGRLVSRNPIRPPCNPVQTFDMGS
jgi:hypothetical protein